jgi:hypothetical protein
LRRSLTDRSKISSPFGLSKGPTAQRKEKMRRFATLSLRSCTQRLSLRGDATLEGLLAGIQHLQTSSKKAKKKPTTSSAPPSPQVSSPTATIESVDGLDSPAHEGSGEAGGAAPGDATGKVPQQYSTSEKDSGIGVDREELHISPPAFVPLSTTEFIQDGGTQRFVAAEDQAPLRQPLPFTGFVAFVNLVGTVTAPVDIVDDGANGTFARVIVEYTIPLSSGGSPHTKVSVELRCYGPTLSRYCETCVRERDVLHASGHLLLLGRGPEEQRTSLFAVWRPRAREKAQEKALHGHEGMSVDTVVCGKSERSRNYSCGTTP